MTRLTKADRKLLADAQADLLAAPTVLGTGRPKTFIARYVGFCPRCGRLIRVGQVIRRHADHDSVAHDRCRAVQKPVTQTVSGVRQPKLCPDCYLEHAGPCW